MLRTKAFTLFEFVVTLSILIILMGLVVPTWQRVRHHNQLQIATTQLLHALRAARMLAIVHDEIVTLCPSDDQHHCQGDWSAGYLLRSTAGVIRAYAHSYATITWQGGLQQKQKLQFLPTGFGQQNGSFKISNASAYRRIIVNYSGRARLEQVPAQQR